MKIPIRQYWNLLVEYLKPLRWRVALLAVLLTSVIAIQLVNPQIIRYFIDTALDDSRDGQSLTLAGVAFLGMALLIQVLSVSATYMGENIGWTATNELRADLAFYTLNLDMAFHNEHTPGDMIERIDGDLMDLAIFFAQFVIKVVANLTLVLCILVMLALTDWRIGAVMAVYVMFTLWAFNRIRDVAQPYWTASRDAASDLFGFLEEHLAGTEDTRSSGAKSYVMRGLFKFNGNRLNAERKAGFMSILVIMLWITLYGTAQIIAFLLAYNLFRAGSLSLGTGFIVLTYTDAMFRPLREISQEIQNLQKAGASIERIQQLYAIESKIKSGTDTALLDVKGALAVTFEDVSFGYSDDELVLKNISFELKPGKVMGLLGRTGSGKTTTTRLLFRLYEITSGKIYLNEHDITDAPLDVLRQKIGMVTQNVQLFRATIRENITFFDPTISDERIMAVIEALELTEWLKALPNGLDTKLEASGGGLSAGESQLLAFARVFLKDPGLIIMDEASSRLDPATEQLIERAVDKLLQNRTGIIIAHRLGTIMRADEIMILKDGSILEHDQFDTLSSNEESHFAGLLRSGGIQEEMA